MAQIRLDSWSDAELHELRKADPKLAQRIERQEREHHRRVRKFRPASNRAVGQYR